MVAPPQWLSSFANTVAAQIHAHDVLSPIGCHYQKVDNVWEVTVFASHTEIVGGSQDGRIGHSHFGVDIKSILEQFSEVFAVTWQTQPLSQYDELGPHLSVEGLHNHKQIWLRVTATAPKRFGAGRRAMVNQRKIEELW